MDFFSTELFHEVQMQQVFKDGKTFVDCTPKKSPEEINNLFLEQKDKHDFILYDFVLKNFELPITPSINYESDLNKSVQENIETLWTVLTREPDIKTGSLIPLPFPYVVPGGRFGEIYYWDSYFTMLGLKVSGKIEMIENMLNNFSHLINEFGYIPNGNRNYFIGRSQPPFYSLMVRLLAQTKGENILIKYLPQMEKEYHFWMAGKEELNNENSACSHVVKMQNGEIMNRYWDDNDTPRPESYREDIELSHLSKQKPGLLFSNLRAGAESGWDYSCRWFADIKDFSTIHTTDIIPVDLNCLLFHLEETIAYTYSLQHNIIKSNQYKLLSDERKIAVNNYCWNGDEGFYFDYDFKNKQQKNIYTLAGIAPLFFKTASQKQADAVKKIIEEKFLQEGGLISTPHTTGQQWDAPNGWAPLQYMTIIGLENYGYKSLAADIAQRWIKLNTAVFKRTGKLMEKYNVMDTNLEAGGGEYESQDGFGWTNGVLLTLIEKYARIH